MPKGQHFKGTFFYFKVSPFCFIDVTYFMNIYDLSKKEPFDYLFQFCFKTREQERNFTSVALLICTICSASWPGC